MFLAKDWQNGVFDANYSNVITMLSFRNIGFQEISITFSRKVKVIKLGTYVGTYLRLCTAFVCATYVFSNTLKYRLH
jgi:hypothetical protein